MTVPGRREAARLLLSLEPPGWFLRHSCAVADVASWLAVRVAAKGRATDVTLVCVAALLHDVDKLPAARVPAHLPHGEGSAAWLAGQGWPELGEAVRYHPVTCLADDARAAWLAAAGLETKIVAYADKRAGQRLESMDARFASWRRRYPSGPGDDVAGSPGAAAGWDDARASRVLDRARALEREVCEAAGVRPGDVGRLRWSRRALREAAR